MTLAYPPWTPEERDDLIAFVVSDLWPYNGIPRPTHADIARWIDAGTYTGTFWIVRDGTRVGILQYEDAAPARAEVHIRLRTPYRGQGIGRQAIAWLTDHLFCAYPGKHRLEGWMRADNVAMRGVFRACGYVKEAYLRQDFPVGDGTFTDKVGYGILRDDWRTGTTTPVLWNDAEALP